MAADMGLTWSDVARWFGTNELLVAVVLVGAVLVSWLYGLFVRRTRDRLERASAATET